MADLEAPEESLVSAAWRIADDLLAPAAEATDRAALVPRDHFEALADAGLMGLSAPTGLGGTGSSPATVRAVFEALAGGCGATFFTWVQHHAPVRALVASANEGARHRWLGRLCRGDVLGGVAFAYLRRPGPPAVRATPVAGGGYRVNGEAPWVTGWGLIDVLAVSAATADGRVVTFLTPPDAPGLSPSRPLDLSVLGATGTVRLRFDDLVVPSEAVVTDVTLAAWREHDAVAVAQPQPAAFGIAERCLRLLDAAGLPDADSRAVGSLAAEVSRCRSHGYALADEKLSGKDPAALDTQLADLVAARAWSLELAARTAHALVVVSGGRAMHRDHPAQRLAREAAFYLVQAQTPSLLQAELRLLAGQPPRSAP